jgi:negative regulator of replication initiation
MQIKKIDIDIEVYKLIESYRIDFNETENDILKRVLNQNEYPENNSNFIQEVNISQNLFINKEGLFWKGVLLKNGLKLRKLSKDKSYQATVINGRIIYNNQEFFSPSAAGVAASGTSVNGWIFWDFFDDNSNSWKKLSELRKK